MTLIESSGSQRTLKSAAGPPLASDSLFSTALLTFIIAWMSAFLLASWSLPVLGYPYRTSW